MGTILELLILLFLLIITGCVVGLVWSFIRKKPKRSWMVGIVVNLLLFIGTSVFYSNYLLKEEQEKTLARYQEQQQATKLQNEATRQFQNYTTTQLNELKQKLDNQDGVQTLQSTVAKMETSIAILNAKMDALTQYVTQYLKVNKK